MLKVNGSSICKPLEMIFKQCIETGAFHSEWKKISIVPIHKKKKKIKKKKKKKKKKKSTNKYWKNDHPVSLLYVCGKILERLRFKEMFKFFEIEK